MLYYGSPLRAVIVSNSIKAIECRVFSVLMSTGIPLAFLKRNNPDWLDYE